MRRLRIPRQKYFPVPGVDGALVTFRLTPPSKRREVPSERGFHAMVSKAFSERRKMMRNSMQPMYSSEQVGRQRTRGLGSWHVGVAVIVPVLCDDVRASPCTHA